MMQHRIEPEQRRSEGRSLCEKFSLLFRRKRGDDFLEAWIAAQRVPPGPQFQPTVAKSTRPPDNGVELFKGEIFIANPGSDHCQVCHHRDLQRYIFFRTRS